MDYLGGHTFNELMTAEAEGTALALAAAARPNATFRLPEVERVHPGPAHLSS